MSRILFICALCSLLVAGCDFKVGDEQAFKSSNPEHMENFMALLNKRNIPYQYSEGYIRYKKNVRPQVEEIEGLLSHTQSIQFKNEKVRQYFRGLLDEENVEYLALEKEDGSWTMWWPHSEEQERELSLKTVEYAFEHKLHKEM